MYNGLVQQQCGDFVISYDHIAVGSGGNLTQARISMKWEVSHESATPGKCGNDFENYKFRTYVANLRWLI